MATETQARDQELRDRIQALTQNNFELARENAQYKLKLEAIQRELEAAQQPVVAKIELTQMASPTPSTGTADAPCGTDCSCQDFIDKALCDRPEAQAAITPPAPSVLLPKSTHRPPDTANELIGCGSCSKYDDCTCYNTSLAVSVPLPKRAISPSSNPTKRTRTATYLDDLATDFTTTSTAPRHTPRRSRTPATMIHMPDPCGFCSDGTPCVCAEMANAMDMEDSDSDSSDSEGRAMKLAPIRNGHGGMLSPPSSAAGDSVPLRRMLGLDRPLLLAPAPSGCKPGGCDQCKTDPMSTLFCQSVATRMQSDKAVPVGCCGGNAAGGGCCKDPPPPPVRKKSANDDRTYIPCSAAYQALSRHRAFDEAAADLGSLVRPLVIQSVNGNCPRVEVSSVRDVLKMLDRRFGRD